MDIKWFKKRQRQVGVTSTDLGQALGRDRSVVSKILNGHQRMSLDQAKVFATVLEVSLDDVLIYAGLADTQTASHYQPGFAESDAAKWMPQGQGTTPEKTIAMALGSDKPGIDIWRVKSTALALAGYMPGDYMLIDTNIHGSASANDIVLAQVYDHQAGSAETLLRRYCPPVLVTASADLGHSTAHIVDNKNVIIMGKVIASWRV